MAYIQKRNGRYRVQVRKDGHTISRTFATKKLAREFAVRLEADAELREALGHGVNRGMTLGELIDLYRKQWRGRDTSLLYRLAWWHDRYGHLRLDRVNKDTVLDALEVLAREPGRRHAGKGSISTGKPRSPATINRYKATLSAVFRWAMKNRELRLPANPCHGIENRTESRGRIRFLSDDERHRLLTACRASDWDRMHLLVSMAITTGARKGELLRLTWADVDFKARRAMVHQTKNGQPRVLPLTGAVVQELMRFRDAPELRLFRGYSDHRWRKALRHAGIDDFRFHDLRHTAASYLAMNGATLLQIAEVLGHKQLEVTKRYAHLCVDHKQNLIDDVMGNVI